MDVVLMYSLKMELVKSDMNTNNTKFTSIKVNEKKIKKK